MALISQTNSVLYFIFKLYAKTDIFFWNLSYGFTRYISYIKCMMYRICVRQSVYFIDSTAMTLVCVKWHLCKTHSMNVCAYLLLVDFYTNLSHKMDTLISFRRITKWLPYKHDDWQRLCKYKFIAARFKHEQIFFSYKHTHTPSEQQNKTKHENNQLYRNRYDEIEHMICVNERKCIFCWFALFHFLCVFVICKQKHSFRAMWVRAAVCLCVCMCGLSTNVCSIFCEMISFSGEYT